MQPILTLKDIARESSLMRSRVVIAFVLVVFLSLTLIARLLQLQVVEYDHFKTLSHNNRVKILPVSPTRGLILDRNGVVLAQNLPTFSLEIVPEAVSDLDELIDSLKKIIDIREIDEQRFRQQVRKKRRFEFVSLRARLSEEEVARFAVNRHRFPGVDIRARLARNYPLGELAVHIVGYVGRISEDDLLRIDRVNYRGTEHIGKTGLEEAYESVLHGRVGYQHVETNAQGRILRVLQRKAPVPGSNLYLNVDASLQATAEAALGEESGAVVALEPSTGAVLALASRPGFDPNQFVDGIDAPAYKALLKSPLRPLFNRAIHGRYPPGSTVKPFVALAGLSSGADHARRQTWCPGWYQLKGQEHRYRDWKKGGHGRVGLSDAIVQSCDVYFYELALSLGIDRLHHFLSQFGFGIRTGIDLIGESEGLNPSPEWKREARNLPWFPGETLIAGIGQGFTLATPLQLASAAATLATRGRRAVPRLVQVLEDPITGDQTPLPLPIATAGQPLNPVDWDTVIRAMRDVVHGARGTARRIGADAQYEMAGKTGTAQLIAVGQDEKYNEKEIEKKYRDHALFIAFAPVDAPRIAVAVLVENGGSGSRAAAPVARRVIDHFLLGPARTDPRNLLLTSAPGAQGSVPR